VLLGPPLFAWAFLAAEVGGCTGTVGDWTQRNLSSESTIRRTLAAVDADQLDVTVGAWMATRVGHLAGRRGIAVDGKSMRGAVSTAGLMPHLLAALHHDTGLRLAGHPHRRRATPAGADPERPIDLILGA